MTDSVTDKWTDAWTDAQKNNDVLVHPYHEGKQIPPSGIGGNSVTDRRTDGLSEAFTKSHCIFLKKSVGIIK